MSVPSSIAFKTFECGTNVRHNHQIADTKLSLADIYTIIKAGVILVTMFATFFLTMITFNIKNSKNGRNYSRVALQMRLDIDP